MAKKRALEVRQLAIEKREEGGKKYLSGVIPFNRESVDMWGTREIIRPGAFKKTIKEQNVRGLWNHNSDMVLGAIKSKTLSLEETVDGLLCVDELPDTTAGRDAWETVSRGDVVTMSFGFYVIRENRTKLEDGGELRELLEVQLEEVSFGVPWPAYPDTTSAARLRSIRDKRGIDVSELEEILEKEGELSAEDRAKITNTLDKLKGILSPSGNQSEPSSDTPPEPSIDYEALRAEIVAL